MKASKLKFSSPISRSSLLTHFLTQVKRQETRFLGNECKQTRSTLGTIVFYNTRIFIRNLFEISARGYAWSQ